MMNSANILNKKDFFHIVKNTPLISIDLIILNTKNEVLLGRRKNEPAKGFWFVPGGRICKDETLKRAFQRILKSEVDVKFSFEKAKFLGVFEHIYKKNIYQDKTFGTHYIVLAYEICIGIPLKMKEDDQHFEMKWFNMDQALNNNRIHKYTRNYFDKF